jgi:hypothetical protein
MLMIIQDFWNVTPCRLVNINGQFVSVCQSTWRNRGFYTQYFVLVFQTAVF